MSESAHQPGAVTIASRLVNESTCVKCGYPLRGLSEAGNCPECGLATHASLDPNRLLHADPRRLQLMQLGFLALAFSPLPAILGAVVASRFYSDVLFYSLVVGVPGWVLGALVLLSVPPRAPRADTSFDGIRRIIRPSVCTVAVLLCAAGVAILLDWLVAFVVLGGAAGCTSLWLGHGVILYASQLSSFADNDRLSKQFREITPYYVVFALASVVALILGLLTALVSEAGDGLQQLVLLLVVCSSPLLLLGGLTGVVVALVLPIRLIGMAAALNRPLRESRDRIDRESLHVSPS